MRLVAHLDELRGDACASVEQIIHAQFAADLRGSLWAVFVPHRRSPRDHPQPLWVQVAKLRDHFFGQAIAEILLIRITTKILEGQYSKHNFPVWNFCLISSPLPEKVDRWPE